MSLAVGCLCLLLKEGGAVKEKKHRIKENIGLNKDKDVVVGLAGVEVTVVRVMMVWLW